MAVPTLTPKSQTSKVILPATGSVNNVASTLPFGIYKDSDDFLSGAADQVAYTFKKLGGDVLDLEITTGSVFAAYEEAVLEYSYLVNIHQSKNVLGDVLGNTTGTFDHHGNLKSSTFSSSLEGTHVGLKFPKSRFAYAKRVSDGISLKANTGGDQTIYSASFASTASQQDYDLQTIISASSANNSDVDFSGLADNRKIIIKDVYYKTPHAMWRFYGYYGGLNTVGNLANYGQYADDSTFQLVPIWQNKSQSRAFEDNIYTRNSHYSYELKNNKLRLYPAPPSDTQPTQFWVRFYLQQDAWEEDSDRTVGVDGINNMSTLPFDNIPYKNINSIGKQWIRRFALSLTKEVLGQVRSKFATIPIPGESVTLNGGDLISQGREEQDKLREELKTVLDELTYAKLAEQDAAVMDAVAKVNAGIALPIFVG